MKVLSTGYRVKLFRSNQNKVKKCWRQQKKTKNRDFTPLKGHIQVPGGRILTNDPIFFIYSSCWILWYNQYHFKNFKNLKDHNRSQIGPPVEPELGRFESQSNYEPNVMVDSGISTNFCDIWNMKYG